MVKKKKKKELKELIKRDKLFFRHLDLDLARRFFRNFVSLLGRGGGGSNLEKKDMGLAWLVRLVVLRKLFGKT